jgi:hypothetical protein
MQYLPLLGKHLKDDDVVEVLEWADAEVVYDFDRTHENMPTSIGPRPRVVASS